MAISKFAIACIAAVFAGGASAGLAIDGSSSSDVQVANTGVATPISAISNPVQAFHNVAVELVSGKTVGHVDAVASDGNGRALRVRMELADMPSQRLWIDGSDLVYSRSRDVIVAHDIHAPAMTVADAR